MTIFIGDVHGKYYRYKKIIKETENTIQVGDMGVGFRRWPHGNFQTNPPFDLMVEGGHRFIRGNHDNPGVCRNHKQWIADGHVENGMMFVGGATSIDKDYRIEDFSWWKDEEIAPDEMEFIMAKYLGEKPDIMVTHECPESISCFLGNTPKSSLHSHTRKIFQEMLNAHRPRVWVFGHWHQSFDRVENGTRFVCLNELEVKEII